MLIQRLTGDINQQDYLTPLKKTCCVRYGLKIDSFQNLKTVQKKPNPTPLKLLRFPFGDLPDHGPGDPQVSKYVKKIFYYFENQSVTYNFRQVLFLYNPSGSRGCGGFFEETCRKHW